jgi:hypothetical protein
MRGRPGVASANAANKSGFRTSRGPMLTGVKSRVQISPLMTAS